MFDKKKDGGGIGLALMGPMGPKDVYEEDETHELDIIADDLLQAIHSADKKGVVEALKAFMVCIQTEDEEQDAQGPTS